jgi:hypothetical protein
LALIGTNKRKETSSIIVPFIIDNLKEKSLILSAKVKGKEPETIEVR